MPDRFHPIARTAIAVLLSLCLDHSIFADDWWSPDLQHLRNGDQREWETFPEGEVPKTFAAEIKIEISGRPATLKLSHRDIKQPWQLLINGHKFARLAQDENPMTVYFEVPGDFLKHGSNLIEVQSLEPNAKTSDDILIGRVELLNRPASELLNESKLDIRVIDAATQAPLPARITILNDHGELQQLGAASNEHLAVRQGTIYTSTGQATCGIPNGNYTIFAGHGFEYSLAEQRVEVQEETREITLTISRQVDTTGYVACDTHVHTLTHSGHGDATIQERMITLAAEGIELPIATDHNIHVDHIPFAREMNVSQFFTPVVGNEYTTPVGHFNIFPVDVKQMPPNHRLDNWPAIFEELSNNASPRVTILNHAQDRHSGVRPFGPENYLAVVGESTLDWPIGFNAMEVLNSSATQTDMLRLFEDWMNLLNAGHQVTPVGSSDSHDVLRHFVGQGRTYIKCDDTHPGQINVDEAIDSFLRGDVVVSYGLWTTLEIQPNPNKEGQISLTANLSCPNFVTPEQVIIYANGREFKSLILEPEEVEQSATRTWSHQLKIPRPTHDMHFVAIAIGSGITQPYWKTAAPYQSVSPHWEPHTCGCSGAKWFDADNDGKRTSASEYGRSLFDVSGKDLNKCFDQLTNYDSAVAAHVAHQFIKHGGSITDEPFQAGLRSDAPAIRNGFSDYFEGLRESELAKLGQANKTSE